MKDEKQIPWIIVATGPSLTLEDLLTVQEFQRSGFAKVCLINDAFAFYPGNPDMLFAADHTWWERNAHLLDSIGGEFVTSSIKTAFRYQLTHAGRVAIGSDYQKGCTIAAMTSGLQALGYLAKFSNVIILLGFDCKAQLGGNRAFGQRQKPTEVPHSYQAWINEFNQYAKSRNDMWSPLVLNATRDSALHCFPKTSLKTIRTTIESILRSRSHGNESCNL